MKHSLREAMAGKQAYSAFLKWIPLDKVDDGLNGNVHEAFMAGYQAALEARSAPAQQGSKSSSPQTPQGVTQETRPHD